MIHIRHEGQTPEIGLNIGWSFGPVPWIRLIWMWVWLVSEEASPDRSRVWLGPAVGVRYYFRVRFTRWPCLIFKRERWDVLEYLTFSRNVVLVRQEVLEDHDVPQEEWLTGRDFV